MNPILLLRCPNCKNQMKYQPKTKTLTTNAKNCVYCGKNFTVRTNIIK